MSEFLGSRISLISKSDIRYVGVLHEINSDESTVSLENVRSFGTEGRRGRPEEEIGASDQVYEYIVFRGSDVKDLRIEEHPGLKENKPPAVPDDPAIVGAARSRPGPPQGQNQNAPPPGPGPYGQFPPGQFYGPPGQWGRGGPGPGPGPGPGFGGNMPYPPPPGWFPPGQGFPPGPGGPGPGQWQNHPFPPGGPGGPGGPMGPDGHHNQRGPPNAGPAQEAKLAAAGAGSSKPTTPSQPGTEQRSQGQQARPPTNAPTPPVESKPSTEEVKATVATLEQPARAAQAAKAAPTGPRNNRVHPVVPLSGSLHKPFQPPAAMERANQNSVQTTVTVAAPNSVQDATSAARAAVAVAMAQLGNPSGNAMDNLTNKVNEMRVNAAVRGAPAGRGGRGGRGGRAPAHKVEVPDSDYDFAEANAKFNKDDVVKEAIAGSPLTETPNDSAALETSAESVPAPYNKTRSFFDNISSEAKERADNNGQKPGGREWRGEEQRRNMETFGQGSVDGGYRGRGRGRGGRGRGQGRGGRGGNRPQFNGATVEQ